MHRRLDHATSVGAAQSATIRKMTMRDRVLQLAHTMRAHGITDDFLKIKHPETPESSLRKRRTELAQENVLLENGTTRPNRHGQQEKVFVHRDYVAMPPPLVERGPTESKDGIIVRMRAQEILTVDMLALALPYVESAEDDEHYSAEGRRRARELARRMRKYIEHHERMTDDIA